MPVSKAEFDAGTAPNCRNKNCKSYGSPHPNCHCFEHVNGMLIGHAPRYAKGGRVPETSFCSEDRMHDKDCPYYCEGGMSYANGGKVKMPLMKGKSKAAFSHNVSTEMHAGKPQNQALAIAYSQKRKHMADGGYAEGGEMEESEDSDHEMMMDHVAMECMQALETKDKAAFKDAFQVLVADCMSKMSPDQDEEQENANG